MTAWTRTWTCTSLALGVALAFGVSMAWAQTPIKHHGELGALVTALGALTGVERAA